MYGYAVDLTVQVNYLKQWKQSGLSQIIWYFSVWHLTSVSTILFHEPGRGDSGKIYVYSTQKTFRLRDVTWVQFDVSFITSQNFVLHSTAYCSWHDLEKWFSVPESGEKMDIACIISNLATFTIMNYSILTIWYKNWHIDLRYFVSQIAMSLTECILPQTRPTKK